MCQDTGTAIIMGKKGGLVFTEGDDEAALAEGARDAYLKRNLRYSQLAPISMFEEKNTKSNMPAQVEIYAEGRGRRLQVPVHRQGRRLGQQVVPVPGDALDPYPRPHDGVPEGEDPDARHRRVPALSPRDRDRRHLGRVDDEDRQARLDAISTTTCRPRAREDGHAFRDLEMEKEVHKLTQSLGVGAQFGGKYFCHDVRVIRLPRHGASLPIGLGRVVLGRPAGARQDHARTACSWRSSSTIRRSICRTWTRHRSAARWSRST